MIKIILLLMLIISFGIKANDSAVEQFEMKVHQALICNSITGAAISEVVIADLIETNKQDIIKITGTYKQDKPFTTQLKAIQGNSFATYTGQFQAFVSLSDGVILKARFKVGLRADYIKESCLKPKTDGFDF